MQSSLKPIAKKIKLKFQFFQPFYSNSSDSFYKVSIRLRGVRSEVIYNGYRRVSDAVKKVVVHLRATGDAPILQQAKFKILGTDKFARVIEFLRRQLHKKTLFVYVNSAFSPNPDELVIDLYNENTKDFIVHKKRDYEFSLTETPEQVEMEVR